MRCFLSTAPGDQHGIRALLEARGVEVFTPEDVPFGPAWHLALRDLVGRMDFSVVIFPDRGQGSSTLLFEAGVSIGLGIPLLLAVVGAGAVPLALTSTPHIRAGQITEQSLGLHLDIFLKTVRGQSRARRSDARGSGPRVVSQGGAAAGESSATYRAGRAAPEIADAIASTGDLVTAIAPDRSGDYVAWLHSLGTSPMNPVLIEVKRGGSSAQVVEQAKARLLEALLSTTAGSALLVVDPEAAQRYDGFTCGPIKVMALDPAPLFLIDSERCEEGARANELGQWIVRARNVAIHRV